MNIGDKVSLKPAILYGMQHYIIAKMGAEFDQYPFAKNIQWGRESFGPDEASEGIISFIEPPKPVDIPDTPENSSVRVYDWTIFVQGIVPDSFSQPTLPAYELAAEFRRILFSAIPVDRKNGMSKVNNIFNLGPTAQRARDDKNSLNGLAIGSETVRGPGEHSRYTFFWLPIHFNISEDLENPRTTIQNPL